MRMLFGSEAFIVLVDTHKTVPLILEAVQRVNQ